MTEKQRLVARLNERVERNRLAADGYRSIDKVIQAAVAQAWADSAQACLDDANDVLDDDWSAFDAVEALSGGYVR